ncbi:MAG: lytic murein transglycosylase [Rhodospirillales bacterium]|nr:lytic murein transglycosylase [Rhodospirillales bacterium]
MRAFRFVLAIYAVFAAVHPVRAAELDFDAWLMGVRAEGLQRGLSARTLDEALAGVAPIPRVLELDRRQPEVTQTFDEYMARVVNKARIETGRQRLAEHRDILDRVSRRYGVQQRFIVALWAIETDFGRFTGNFPVIAALATLAHDGRRSAFFREELFNALTIVDRSFVAARDMRGSWAGAMGQSQFMPSSFLAFAVDGDGDGKIDIWNSRTDVFASAANYLAKSGWKDTETWGREVRLPTGFDRALIEGVRVQTQKPLSQWQALGVRRADGGDLPGRDLMASLIQPGGSDGRAYLVYDNYRVLLRWNRSLFFATAVGHLADQIGDR